MKRDDRPVVDASNETHLPEDRDAAIAVAAEATAMAAEDLQRSAEVVAAAGACDLAPLHPWPHAPAPGVIVMPPHAPPLGGPTCTEPAVFALRQRIIDELGSVPHLGRGWPEDPDQTFPSFPAPMFRTPGGAAYFRDAGVALIARPHVHLAAASPFLADLGDADGYLQDLPIAGAPSLVKFAGQLCYLSLDEDRTKNRDVLKYLQNIKSSGHGSVLEHAHYAVLLWGVSRALTHEAVRHRIAGYSQVSQRYVPPRRLRFVEGREFQNHRALHARFESWIDASAVEYAERERLLLLADYPHDFDPADRCRRCHKAALQLPDDGEFEGADARRTALELPCVAGLPRTDSGRVRLPTDARKKVRQAARRCLPNETEAPIVMSMNLRAWRHVLESRVNRHADVEIRRAYYRVFLCLAAADPLLWADYQIAALPDGTHEITTPYRKI